MFRLCAPKCPISSISCAFSTALSWASGRGWLLSLKSYAAEAGRAASHSPMAASKAAAWAFDSAATTSRK